MVHEWPHGRRVAITVFNGSDQRKYEIMVSFGTEPHSSPGVGIRRTDTHVVRDMKYSDTFASHLSNSTDTNKAIELLLQALNDGTAKI